MRKRRKEETRKRDNWKRKNEIWTKTDRRRE